VTDAETPPPTAPATGAVDGPRDDPAAHLLGLLAYGEVCACEHLARATALAPQFADRLAMLEVAAVRVDHHRALRRQLADAGVTPVAAMEPYRAAIDEFHAHTAPRTWAESLVKAYVGDGWASDLLAEAADAVGGSLGTLLREQAADTGQAAFAEDRIAALLRDDVTQAGRLALWARRLVGEALTQAQRLAADHPRLATLVTGSDADTGAGADLAAVTAMFSRLLKRHDERMVRVGLRG